MTASPVCEVRQGAGSYVSTVGGVDVTSGASMSIRLADTTSVDTWELQIHGTDELTTIPPTLTGVNPTTHVVTSPSTVVTFTYPAATGRALGFTSTVHSGGNTYVTTFGIYTLINSQRVGFVGEIREGSVDYGWSTKTNPLIRSGSFLPALPGVLYAMLMENPIGNKAWIQPSLDMILPAFQPSLSGGGLREVSQSVVTPAFTASYTTSPVTVTLTDTEGTSPKDVSGTPTSFTSNGTFVKNSYGLTVTFTITAQKDGVTRTSNTTLTWAQKVFWGVSSSGGPYNEAFIEGLASNALATTRARSISFNAGSGAKAYYAFRTAYGTPNFNIGGFDGGFELIASAVSVTNTSGFTETYDVWRSVQANLGSFTATVT